MSLSPSLSVSPNSDAVSCTPVPTVVVADDNLVLIDGTASTFHVYDATAVTFDPYSASTRKVCDPAARPEYDCVLNESVVPHTDDNVALSSEHLNSVNVNPVAATSEYLNNADVLTVGL